MPNVKDDHAESRMTPPVTLVQPWGGYGAVYVPNWDNAWYNEGPPRFPTAFEWELAQQQMHIALAERRWMKWQGGYQWQRRHRLPSHRPG